MYAPVRKRFHSKLKGPNWTKVLRQMFTFIRMFWHHFVALDNLRRLRPKSLQCVLFWAYSSPNKKMGVYWPPTKRWLLEPSIKLKLCTHALCFHTHTHVTVRSRAWVGLAREEKANIFFHFAALLAFGLSVWYSGFYSYGPSRSATFPSPECSPGTQKAW